MGGEGAIGHSSVVEESYGDLLFEVLGYGQGMEQGNVVKRDYGDAGYEGGEMDVVDESYGGLQFETLAYGQGRGNVEERGYGDEFVTETGCEGEVSVCRVEK